MKAGSGSGNATSALVAPPVVSQCNGIGNAGGQAVACTVTVINNIDLASGASLSSVTVNQCTGAANAPLTCVASTTISNQVVQAVTQCNGSGSGGGGTVTCSVEIINNIFGSATSLPATVNQCNGSGQGGGANTLACSPTGATTNATVTQCDGSGNGGGGPTRVQCTVTPSSTQTPALPVTVDQCNGSANGGGATVTCTVSLTNSFFPALLFPGDLLPPGPGTGFPVAPPIGGPPGGPPGQGPPGRATAVALRQGTATAFLTPAGSTGRSAAAGSLARTGVDSRSMSVVALLSTLVGGLLVGLGRRKRRVGTVATS